MGINICQKKCFGYDNYHGSCCSIEQRNYIIGPVVDHMQFLEKIREKYQGVDIQWEDIFISYEEGSRLFPDKSNWQDPKNFPAFRVNLEDSRKPCVFYNTTVRACSIYEIRPGLCRTYYCDYLKSQQKNSSGQ